MEDRLSLIYPPAAIPTHLSPSKLTNPVHVRMTTRELDILREVVNGTPFFDNHAHPILKTLHQINDVRSMATEATGEAISDSVSSLASIRAVKQLAALLECEPNWHSIENARKNFELDELVKKCFDGIRWVAIDDGIGENLLETWEHGKFGVKVGRIVRVETLAEELIAKPGLEDGSFNATRWIDTFQAKLKDIASSKGVVGLKTAVCYRTGLEVGNIDLGVVQHEIESWRTETIHGGQMNKPRLNSKALNDWVVHQACAVATLVQKPLQLHTGLGDIDLDMQNVNPL